MVDYNSVNRLVYCQQTDITLKTLNMYEIFSQLSPYPATYHLRHSKCSHGRFIFIADRIKTINSNKKECMCSRDPMHKHKQFIGLDHENVDKTKLGYRHSMCFVWPNDQKIFGGRNSQIYPLFFVV